MAADSHSLKEIAFGDLERELHVTRRVLERVPNEHLAWKPHEKSMSLGRLAHHVATLPMWMHLTIFNDVFDMATAPPPPSDLQSRDELLAVFDAQTTATLDAMRQMEDAALMAPWTLRNGEAELIRQPRARVLRMWSINHLIHHRAQLCVYLRLLDVPVPAVYFNSADEPEWVLE